MATRTSTITARAWFTSIFIFFFGRGLLNASWASRGPDVQSMLHISIAQMGILAAVFSAGAVLGVLVAGRLITVYGSRRVSLVGFLVMTAGLAATVSAVAGGSFPLTLVGLFVFGFPFGTVDFVSNVEAGELDRASSRNRIPMLHGGYSIGFLVGAAVTSVLIVAGIPFLAQLLVSCLLVGVVSLIRAWTLPDHHGRHDAGEDASARTTLTPAAQSRVRKLSAIAFIFVLAEGTAAVFIPLALVAAGRTTAEAAIAFTLFSLGMAIARIFGGRVADRIGRRAVILWSSFLCAGGIALFTLAFFVPVEYPAALAWGLGNSLAIGMTVSAVTDNARTATRSQSTLWTWVYVANLSVGPVLGGLSAAIGIFPALLVPFALLGGSAWLSRVAERDPEVPKA